MTLTKRSRQKASAILERRNGQIFNTISSAVFALGGAGVVLVLGRELLRNPSWPLQAAHTLNYPAPVPPQYRRAYEPIK